MKTSKLHDEIIHVESFSGHGKTECPELEMIRDAATLEAALKPTQQDYNTVRLHTGIGYIIPDDDTKDEEHAFANADAKA